MMGLFAPPPVGGFPFGTCLSQSAHVQKAHNRQRSGVPHVKGSHCWRKFCFPSHGRGLTGWSAVGLREAGFHVEAPLTMETDLMPVNQQSEEAYPLEELVLGTEGNCVTATQWG